MYVLVFRKFYDRSYGNASLAALSSSTTTYSVFQCASTFSEMAWLSKGYISMINFMISKHEYNGLRFDRQQIGYIVTV